MSNASRSSLRWRNTFVAVPLVALVLAGCAGDANPSEGTDGEVAAPGSISIGFGGAGATCYSAAYIAQGKGYFDEAMEPFGTSIEYIDLAGSVGAVQALATDGVDITTSTTSAALAANAQGATIVQLSQFLRNDVDYLLAPAGTNASVSNPAEIVRGKKWGVPSIGSAGHLSALVALDAWGFDESEVTFVPLGSTAESMAAIERGAADFYWVGAGAGIEALVQDGTLEIVLDLFDPAKVEEIYGGGLASCGMFTQAKFVEQYPEVATAIVEALDKALAFMDENRDNTHEILVGLPEQYQSESNELALPRMIPGSNTDSTVHLDDVRNTIKAMLAGELIDDAGAESLDLEAFVFEAAK